MLVASIMTGNPVTAHPNDTLRTALEKMSAINVNHLPVMDSDNHLIGIISDRDLRRALDRPQIGEQEWRDTPGIDRISVRRVMTPAPIIIEPHAPVVQAARLMLVNHISSLPVMRGETLVGIVTKSDILVAFMRYHDETVDNDALISLEINSGAAK